MQNNLQLTQSKTIDDKALWAIADRTEKQVQAADSKFERMLDENKQRQSQTDDLRSKALAKENDIRLQRQQDQNLQSKNENKRVETSQSAEHAQISRSDKSTTAQPFDTNKGDKAEKSIEQPLSDSEQEAYLQSQKLETEKNYQSVASEIEAFSTSTDEQQSVKISTTHLTAEQAKVLFQQVTNGSSEIAVQQELSKAKTTAELTKSANELAKSVATVSAAGENSAGLNTKLEPQISVVKDLKADAQKLEQSLKEISTNDKASWLDGIMQLANQNANKSSDEKAISKVDAADADNELTTAGQNELDEFAKLIASFKSAETSENALVTAESDATIEADQTKIDAAVQDAAGLNEQLKTLQLSEAEIDTNDIKSTSNELQVTAGQSVGADASTTASENEQQVKVQGQALNAVTSAIEAELNKNNVAAGETSKPVSVTNSNTTAAALANVINKNNMDENAAGKNNNVSQSVDGSKLTSESQIHDELLAKLAGEEKLASRDITSPVATVLNAGTALGSTEAGSLLADSTARVELGAVQLEKTMMAAKLDIQTQIKHDVIIKENVLFNKQELAANVQQQVGMMMARNMKSIDIRLDPPELGSIRIKMQLNGDQAAVSFMVSSQQAKDALENAMPKLKEMLEQQGMELADSDVQHEQSGQGGTEAGAETHHAGTKGEDSTDEHLGDATEVVVDIPSPYKVDYYA
ncbi:flagellar hook-length control protein FliK [Psychrosphaera sp. B3R10]|uniref:flagellar hook-length control protein FliK n=1 Tax=unclassified Psychrosphaera TaxID=2641570 RepID=UPI001C0A5532|nr:MULTISPECIES: flagellar hook-length control protein FliK [unclassified Psychrosphaera]MBU2884094.1 flagellar hook-length control protein FliK [Psychrosphaera sp. I2R16]MBU2988224.1 flagellar hook-length control protein FliK [Psychrosphaera sp. B3R10]